MRTGLVMVVAMGCVPEEAEPVAPEGEPSVSEEVYSMTGFSFVQDDLAGLPQPGGLYPLEQDLTFLLEQQIDVLVSLTVDPTDPDLVAAAGLQLVHLPIEDYQPPTPQQQRAFVEGMMDARAAGQRVAVHCTAGLGRTGTMLATWFVAQGMDGATALAEIRRLRPGSVETRAQEAAIYSFAESWSEAR